MRAGTELDKFLRVFHPVRYGHKARNPKIAGDVEHPEAASGFGKLDFQITDVGFIELAEIDFRPLQSIVPPDRVCIPFHQLRSEEHTSELQSPDHLVCRLLLEKTK